MNEEHPAPEQTPADEQPAKKKRGHNLKDGQRGGSVFRIMQARKGVPYKEPKKDGAPEELMDMRHVLLNPAKYDVSEHQLFLRKLKKEDPKGFILMVSAAEDRLRKDKEAKKQAAAVAPSPADSSEEVEIDHGTARCIELVEHLLEEFH